LYPTPFCAIALTSIQLNILAGKDFLQTKLGLTDTIPKHIIVGEARKALKLGSTSPNQTKT
jgi:hypothetical protein